MKNFLFTLSFVMLVGCNKSNVTVTPVTSVPPVLAPSPTPSVSTLAPASALTWANSSPNYVFNVTANWTLASGDTITAQSIQYYSDASCTVASGAPVTLTTSATSDNFLGSDLTTYSYKITSIDSLGNSVVSSCSSAMVLSSEACSGTRLTNAPYAGGSGTIGDPYFICTATQMNAIGLTSSDWNKNFKLYGDINLSAYTGTQFNMIGSVGTNFTGVFDGNNHTISNLSISVNTANSVGLFAYMSGGGAVIKNLTLSNVSIVVAKASVSIGALVGIMSGGTLTNINILGGSLSQTAIKSLQYLGGAVGSATNATLNSVTSSINIAASTLASAIGGVVGTATTTTISTNSFTGVMTSCSGNDTGGIVGYMSGSTIDQSYSTGTVYSSPGQSVGGLVGAMVLASDITKSYSTGSVSGNTFADGGLVGNLGSSAGHGIFNSYTTSSVSGFSNAGGLIGLIEGGNPSITNVYAAGAVVAFIEVGGLVANDNDNAAHKGVYTAAYWNNQVNSTLAGIGQGVIPGQVIGANTATLQSTATFVGAGWTSPTWNLTTTGIYLKLGWQP